MFYLLFFLKLCLQHVLELSLNCFFFYLGCNQDAIITPLSRVSPALKVVNSLLLYEWYIGTEMSNGKTSLQHLLLFQKHLHGTIVDYYYAVYASVDHCDNAPFVYLYVMKTEYLMIVCCLMPCTVIKQLHGGGWGWLILLLSVLQL